MSHLSSNAQPNSFAAGVADYIEGFRLLAHPKIRPFVVLPLLVNVVIGVVIFSVIYHYTQIITSWDWQLPSWLVFLEKALKGALWLLVVVFFFIIYSFSFNVITTTVAAPFYGLLAQKTEELLTGTRPPDETITKMIPRTIIREVQKMLYFCARGLLVFLLIILMGTVVFLSPLTPLVGLAWAAWCMAIQYVDFSADNHQTPFRRVRKKLRKPLSSTLGFGGAVIIASMIPIISFVAPIAAVTGGTRLWVREIRNH